MTKSVKTSLLDMAYEENGEAHDPVIVFLHGFPDDARTWDGITPAFVRKGYRTLAPYHRGYGDTVFHSGQTMRSGQYAALVSDLIEFLDALHIDNCILVGHDWGAMVAFKTAALYPQRIKGLVTIASAYNGADQPKLSLVQTQAYWYQWYFNTEQGKNGLENETEAFCEYLWQLWSPGWKFDKDKFRTTAASWKNKDFVSIVLHSYRHRWKNENSDARYESLEKQLKEKPEIEVPVIFLQGDIDGASLPESSLHKEKFFSQHYERRLIQGAGHFIQREKPAAVLKAIEDLTTMISVTGIVHLPVK